MEGNRTRGRRWEVSSNKRENWGKPRVGGEREGKGEGAVAAAGDERIEKARKDSRGSGKFCNVCASILFPQAVRTTPFGAPLVFGSLGLGLGLPTFYR